MGRDPDDSPMSLTSRTAIHRHPKSRWTLVRWTLLLGIVLLTTGTWLPPVAGKTAFGGDSVEDLRAGRFYHGGTRVRIPFLGVSFKVPRHWRVRLPAGSQVAHLDSPRKPGLGLVIVLDRTTAEEVEARLNEPFALEEAYVLDPTAPVRREASRLYASYMHGDQVGRAVALLGPASQAMVYFIAGPEEEGEGYEALLAELAASTDFMSRETVARLKAWYGQLMGQRLSRSAGHESRVWHLCGDGTFLHEFRRTNGAGEEADGFDESGTWRVEIRERAPRLVLEMPHALPREHRLARQGEAVTLDEEVFERSLSNRCL